jgi:hypothetical protein
MRHQFLLLSFVLILLPVKAQEIGNEEKKPTTPLSAIDRKREALSRILIRRQALIVEIQSQREIAKNPNLTEFERDEAAKKIADFQIEIDVLNDEFGRVATGADFDVLEQNSLSSIDFNEELKEIFKPVIQEFRDITAEPREAEDLRSEIADINRRLAVVSAAEDTLAETISDKNPAALRDALKEEATTLASTRQDLETELGIAQTKLEDMQEDSPTFVTSLSTMVQDFFRTRGAHLLIAFLAAGGVILFVRLLYRLIMKFSPKKVNKGENFTGRLIHLGYIVVSCLGAILAFIIALYLTNDWLLLALALLFLFGVAWTGKHTLPKYFDQTKMMLNLGSVRHGERIIYQGIPWEVQKINFYTDLRNPALEGGLIRLPMRDLMPLHSRPNGPRELWFPSREDDWVILTDGTFGKVLEQTPDYVHLVKLGGSRKVIPTADFLGLHPENISRNFRITVTFGIDYNHQDIATIRVPKMLEASIQRALLEKINKEQLYSLKVFFTSASASSLDYRIVADFSGELAPRMNALRDHIQATCVEVCNKNAWVIPFTQITVHEAEKSKIAAESEPAHPSLP